MLLRYTACTGLINQHYSHIASFVLAAVLGAEVVLPPAAKRDSFGHYFSTYKVRQSTAGGCRGRVDLVLGVPLVGPVHRGGAADVDTSSVECPDTALCSATSWLAALLLLGGAVELHSYEPSSMRMR